MTSPRFPSRVAVAPSGGELGGARACRQSLRPTPALATSHRPTLPLARYYHSTKRTMSDMPIKSQEAPTKSCLLIIDVQVSCFSSGTGRGGAVGKVEEGEARAV